MQTGSEGFLYPIIDNTKCTLCGICFDSCPQTRRNAFKESNITAIYACQALDHDILLEATAGGLFPVLANSIIQKGGLVYGAVYDENMKVVHEEISCVKDINRMNGSKYVQSDISQIMPKVKKALTESKTVLFSGTPCQIEAIKGYCDDVDTSKFYTLDVVCYGVPSPKLFRDYIGTVEKENNSKVIDFRFRDKHSIGWSHTTVIKLKTPNDEIKQIEEFNYKNISYYRMFARRDCFRKSCYRCKYNTLHRYSDITTGNFWNIEKISEAFNTKLGVSMALINTKKGQKLFDSIRSELFTEVRSIDEAMKSNDALYKGSCLPWQRNKIYKFYNSHGFTATINHFYSASLICKLRMKLGRVIHIIKRR